MGSSVFFNNTVVVFKNVTLIRWYINLAAPKMTEFLMSSVTLLHCEIYTFTMPQALRMENSVSIDGSLWDFSAINSEGVLNLSNCTFHGVYPILIEGKITARVRDCILFY